MLSFLALICTLKYIPDEFQDIREKAIQSSKIRKLSKFKIEPIISPSKPYIVDSFIGTVLYPVFGPTVKELKGFAIAQSKQHMALIVDRESESGTSILKENSVFLGENNISVSLSHKFADDGEVAIFNLTEIDPLAAFNNFDISLSDYDSKCKGNFGGDMGGRCQANLNLNYDVDNNKPEEITIDELPQEAKDNMKFYGGAHATAVASVTVKKRGAAISVEFNGGLDVIGGAGFHIKKVHNLVLDGEIPLGDEIEVELATTEIPIFTSTIELNTKIFASIVAKDVKLDIPHDIKIMRRLKIHLKKGFTVSTKHSFTTDLEKKVQISKIDTDSKELGAGEEQSIKADFSGQFIVRAGINVELSVNDVINFGAKVGPEFGLDLEVNSDTEKCVYPGLYGHFSPFVNTFLELSGMLKIASMKLLDTTKSWSLPIYKLEHFDGCFFDSSSSTELDKELLQKPEVQRDIIQVVNPVDKKGTYNEFVLLLSGINDQNQLSYIGSGLIELSKQEKSQYNPYYIIPQSKAYTFISASTLDPVPSNDVQPFPFEKQQQAFDTERFSFECVTDKSTPISIGNQFNIDDLDGFFNFRPKFMPSSKNKQAICVILHTEKDGYICDHNKYIITDEVLDKIYSPADQAIHKWIKFTIKQVTATKECFLCFSQWLDKEKQSRLISVQLILNENDVFLPAFPDFYFMAQIKPDIKQNDKVFTINILCLDEQEPETISVTYKDIIRSHEFTKTSKNSDVKMTITREDSNAIEYILKLDEEYVESIKYDKNLEMKAIVSRSSFSDDPSKYIYEGNPITSTILMEQDETYGVFEFLFDASIYDLPNNDNVFAFFKLENATPLSESTTIVGEAESLYVVKLEIGKCVTYDPNNLDILSIPFRRLSKTKDQRIECKLYSIFQSYENNKNSNPFCPDFPSFKIKPIDKFYAGCIISYVDATDKVENEWDHYPEKTAKSVDYPQGTAKSGSFSRLHQISLLKTNTNTENPEPIEIVAKQKYFYFPLKSRTMIIEDSTVQNFRQFAQDEPIRVNCPRCGDIYRGSFLNGEKVYKSGQIFEIFVDENSEGFTLQSMCKPETEDKLRTFCVFDYDINGDGYTLLEYKRYKDDDFTDLVGKVLEEETEENKTLTEYPGVEEIYEIENDAIPKLRLNINCNRQIVPPRTDKFYLTKPWNGSVVKLATHLEQGVIDIELTAIIESDFVEITAEGKGFKAKNSAIDDTQLLPFNPVFFTESEEQFKTLLDQVGVVNFNSIDDVTTNNYVEVDDDGRLIIKKEKFDKEKLKSSVENNKIDLIPIPSENYKLSYTIIDNSGSQKRKLKPGQIAGIVTGSILGAGGIITLILFLLKKTGVADVFP